jgi:outer membrane immunogenic protein
MRHPIMDVVAIASLSLMASGLAAQAQPPDATLRVHTVSIAAGAGYSWGGGIVTYQGHEYPCRIDGLAVGAVGISSVDAIGTVYHLTHIEDFSGDDLAVSAGALLAGGGDVATMRNQHGVVIALIGTSQGAKIMLAVQGVKIALAGAPTASMGP